MNRLGKLSTALLAASLLGCASQPLPMTRDEQLATTVRVYPGKTREQIIDAAQRVLTLADEEDFVFVHVDKGFQATRRWTLFLVFAASVGHDYWAFNVEDADGSPRASVQVTTSQQAVGIQPTIPVRSNVPQTYGTATTPVNSTPIQGTALYDLFWARMDYMLHKSNTWPTCQDALAKAKAGSVHGSNAALCNSTNVDDYSPGQLKRMYVQKVNRDFPTSAPPGPTRALDRPPL